MRRRLSSGAFPSAVASSACESRMISATSTASRVSASANPHDANAFALDLEHEIAAMLEQETAANTSKADVLFLAARHLVLAKGAKRARARLTQLFGNAVGCESGTIVDIAVAAELIHAASLLHDDVIDNGTTRRGAPTANAVWGNTVAVLAGDLVLTMAFTRLRHLPREVTADAVDLVHTMTVASMREVGARGTLDLTLTDWRAIAEGKTGALFAWSGKSVARCATNPDAAARFDTCGKHLGVAFQLADDLKDLVSEEDGKDRFADIRNANPSYPLFVAAERDRTLREGLNSAWLNGDSSAATVERLGQRVLATGAAEATYDAIGVELSRAFEALGQLRHDAAGRELEAWSSVLYKGLHNRHPQSAAPTPSVPLGGET